MAYNKLKYNGITTITAKPSGGLNTIVTINMPTSAYSKVITLDTIISTYGGASIPECSIVARYISFYSVSSIGDPTFLKSFTICEKIRNLLTPAAIWVYSEVVSSDNILIKIDTTDWYNDTCLYDISLEY